MYTIVLFEKSPAEFKEFPERYIHRFVQKSDSGININLLQEYLFIPLDIFKKIQQNGDGRIKIENRLEAWLAFFCMDDPDAIVEIINKYPDFKEMYDQVYDICRNIEEVMQMFSKELLELDRNTVKLMIDDMQKKLKENKDEISRKNEQINQQSEQINQQSEEIKRLKEELERERKR